MLEWIALTAVAMVGAGAAAGDASRPVAWRDGRLIHHDQFTRDVAAWRSAFGAHNGSRFALSFTNSYDFATALFGAWHAGKQVYLPGDTLPSTLARLAPLVDGWAGELPDEYLPLSTGAVSGASSLPREPLDLQKTSALIYTSGTNGEPLAIVKNLSQLDAEIHALQKAFGDVWPEDVSPLTYSTVSHQHIYGLLFCVLWPLAAGRPFVAERLIYPEQMAANLGRQASLLVSSPAHLGRLPEALDWQAAQDGLLAVFSSGGPLSVDAASACLDLLGQSPREVYGSSETGGVAWRQRAVHGDRWQPLPGIDWRVADDVLEVRSRHLSTDEWWQTSDRIAADGSGGFVLLGRADRIVKIEEKRVSLTAIEATLHQCAEIAEARAFMLATSAGPKLAVVAVPTAMGWDLLLSIGKRAFSERLRQSLLSTVERVALPRRWRFRRVLPVNSQGKSTEALLAALFRPLKPNIQWLAREAAQVHAVLDITPELAVFDGHFEQQLVLPGVAQLGWAIDLARDSFGLLPRFLRVDALKFQRPVLPPTRLEIKLSLRKESEQVGFQFMSALGLHSSGVLVFGDA
jgi:acyl-CoA synthetase (AMP-forming)/AMP-acid ligase II